MDILDDLEEIKRLDKSNVLGSIDLFLKQCVQALEETEKLTLPYLSGKVRNIIVPGMGGSAFAPEIVKTLFAQEIKLPYEILRGYHLPGYVDENSLVIVSSYSGTTKEAISAGKEALKRKAKVLVICRQRKNELSALARKYNLPGYIFKERYNPALQPRLGVGYMVCGHAGLLIKTGLINLSFKKLREAVFKVKKLNQFSVVIKSEKNQAKQMAKELKNKFVFLVSSEFLEGAIHGFANQLNETAKANSAYHFIPELNHHRLEGLEFPKEFKKYGIFVFYPSPQYDQRVQVRYKLTQEIIEKNGYRVLQFEPRSESKVSQAFEVIMFNSYVSFYLAMLYGKDPERIPWVEFFKKKLEETGDER